MKIERRFIQVRTERLTIDCERCARMMFYGEIFIEVKIDETLYVLVVEEALNCLVCAVRQTTVHPIVFDSIKEADDFAQILASNDRAKIGSAKLLPWRRQLASTGSLN